MADESCRRAIFTVGIILASLGIPTAQAFTPTPGSGVLTADSGPLTFRGNTRQHPAETGVNPVPATPLLPGVADWYPCQTNTYDCDSYDLVVTLADADLPPDSGGTIEIELASLWEQQSYDLYLYDPESGSVVAQSARTPYVTDGTRRLIEIPARAGTVRYRVDVVPDLVLENSYEATIRLRRKPAPLPAPPAPPAVERPRVVLAVIDGGFNPYHGFFREGSPIYPVGAPPEAITLPLLREFGLDTHPECWLQLSQTGDFHADYAADLGRWDAAADCDMVWFVGTNVLAKSFTAGRPAYQPGGHELFPGHGMAVSAAALTANPEAVILLIPFDFEGEYPLVDVEMPGPEHFVMTHPSVDLINTSYGAIYTGSSVPPKHIHSSYTGTYEYGKLHFSASMNTPHLLAYQSSGGPWWSVGVGGFEETQANEGTDSANGRQPSSTHLTDFIGDFTQQLPYCSDCESGTLLVAGTSFASPRAAGTASRVLLQARREMNHLGGIFRGQGRPLMAAGVAGGRPVTFTNWELRRALQDAAWVPTTTDYDATAEDQGHIGPPTPSGRAPAYPVVDAAPWLAVGWGVLTPDPKRDVVRLALRALGLGSGAAPAKDAGFCRFQDQQIVARKLYWDRAVTTSETFNNAPTPDPYIYCDPLAASLVTQGPRSADEDADADGFANGSDNCPVAHNQDQRDSNGDGRGDACEVQPVPFHFIDRLGVATGVFVTSEARAVEGFAGELAVEISAGGQYSINGAAYTAAAGRIAAGQELRVRHLSASSEDTETVTVVSVGTYSTLFRSVTSATDPTPDPFSFGRLTGVAKGALVESDTITLSGFNTAIPVQPETGLEYRIDGGDWTADHGVLLPEQTLQVRHWTHATSNGYTKSYLQAGGVVGYFTTRSKP